jgi:S-adenosylmethionine uptake transporter
MAREVVRTTNILAAVAMLSGSALIATSDSLLKIMLAGASSLSVLGIRSLFVVILILLIATRIGLRKIVQTKHRMLHAFRMILGGAGTIAFFESLRHLPLATAVILSFLSPLIMNALAPLLLGEKLRLSHLVGATIGFCGAAVVIFQPHADQISVVGVAYGLASSLSLALSWMIVRRIGAHDHLLSFLLFLNIGTLAAGLLATIPLGILPSKEITFVAAIMAALVLSGNLLMVKAYMLAPVTVVAPLIYSQILWAAFLQIIVWNEIPTPRTMIGAALIIAAGLIATLLPRSGSSGPPDPHLTTADASGEPEAPNRPSHPPSAPRSQ